MKWLQIGAFVRRAGGALLVTACSSTPPPAASATTASPTVAPPAPTAASPSPLDAPSGAGSCALVPMRLIIETPEGGPSVMMSLDESGVVGGPPPLMAAAGRTEVARFDDRGCMYDAEGVVADLARDDMWTPRTVMPAKGRAAGPYTIDPEGRVSSAAGVALQMRFEGFEERGLCAAKLLLGVMSAMFAGASMAVVDGVATTEPPLAASACPERHARRAP